MKEFRAPSMTLIQLKKENIICESSCPPYWCTNYNCNDCAAECGSAFGKCQFVTCNVAYEGTCQGYCVGAYSGSL